MHRKGTEIIPIFSFRFFSLLFLLLFVQWHIHKSRVSIPYFIHSFTDIYCVVGRGAKTMCKRWRKIKMKTTTTTKIGTRVRIIRPWFSLALRH